MLTYWMDVNDPFRAFDSVRRRMDQVFREYDESAGPRARLSYPRASLRAGGENVQCLTADARRGEGHGEAVGEDAKSKDQGTESEVRAEAAQRCGESEQAGVARAAMEAGFVRHPGEEAAGATEHGPASLTFNH